MDLTKIIENDPRATLRRIAENDKVDDEFRRRYLKSKIWPSLGISIGGLATTVGAAYTIYNQLLPIVYINEWRYRDISMLNAFLNVGVGILGLTALCYAIESVPKLFKAVKTKNAFEREKRGHQYRHQADFQPHYMDGLVSAEGTAVEREYGSPIMVVNSLDELKEKHHGKESDSPYVFIDHLVMRDNERNVVNWLRREAISNESDITHYEDITRGAQGGVLTIERLGNITEFRYLSTSKTPEGIWNMAQIEKDREFALLARLDTPQNTGLDSFREMPFRVEKIYYHDMLK